MEIKKCKDLGTLPTPINRCECCNYETLIKQHYIKHLETSKHKRRIATEIVKKPVEKLVEKLVVENPTVPIENISQNVSQNLPQNVSQNVSKKDEKPQYSCKICSRNFVTTSGLWKHSKKCDKEIPVATNSIDNIAIDSSKSLDNQQIFLDLMRHNKEMQNLWIEQTKELHDKMVEKMEKLASTNQITNNNSNNHTINSNNKQFNLNFFLHETCKDALNFSDFITSITQNLKLEDLEQTGRLGYVDGLSRIFVNALKNTELERRPLHCTDIKRETVYIKEEDKWEKENLEKDTLKNAIDLVAKKNMSQIDEWKDQNPKCLNDTNSNESAVLNKLYMTTIGGFNDDEDAKMKTKIVKNVLTEVVVDKGIICNVDCNIMI